ncbi:DNA polymerase II [Sorangium cellulosum]|uniref:DNA polymerase n=1 Tax=Sorangium cellulosum TaxID=56 RepID=A0A2L0F165_SORCE|nr:DNA polymerase II [Sorangium cellulosum]AUX45304.1 DNA polymerase II [Sorangium cellulosum]
MADRGFILTPTTRIVAGCPEVHLHAVMEDGEPALVIEDRFRPYFFVRARDEDAARRVAGGRVAAEALTTLDGEPVLRVDAALPRDVASLRERLGDTGVECFEADVRFAYRFLIDRGIRGAFAVSGPFERRPGVGRVYRDPELTPASFVPSLRVLSLDIETSLDGEHLYSIGLAGAGGERCLLVRGEPVPGGLPAYVERFSDERSLLERFLAHVAEADPDVLTGWNIPDFDLPALQRYCRRAGLRCALGRGDEEISILRDPGFSREARAVLTGRVVLDGLSLVRSAFMRLDDYRLETAARTILGRGKLFGPEDRGAQIEASYRDDPARLAAYNLEDARLVRDLLEKTGLVELSVRRSLLTGMQLDRVGAQIAAIDSLYLPALRARGKVAPSVSSEAPDGEVEIAGGLVLDSVPGLYRNILVYDYKSLYPSLIRTFNIDPLTFVAWDAEESAALIRTPGGAAFRRGEPGILPELVARLWDERADARRAGDERGATAIKILMNSLFGVLGSPASRLFSPAVANAITSAGQHVIRLAAEAVRRAGHRVLYGDTDSLFVDSGEPDVARALARAEELRALVSESVAAEIERSFGCESRLELEFEKLYTRFLLPELRGAAQGSKKRYAGLVVEERGDAIEIVGLEAVRRDASAVARRFQRELLDLVFHDRPVAEFVRTFVAELRAGRFDAELTYKKALRKPLDAYTKTTPPHVKAARKLGGDVGRIVTYVITRAGPEPVGMTTAPPDYDHYVSQQLKPIADSVLRWLGGDDFDAMIGARRQLSLF